MNNSDEYKKSIEEARRSIEMLVNEYKDTTMSPSLIDRSYCVEKPCYEAEKLSKRSLEDIRSDIQRLVEEYRKTAPSFVKKEKPLDVTPVAETIDNKTITSAPQATNTLSQNDDKVHVLRTEPLRKKNNSSGIASSLTKSVMLQSKVHREGDIVETSVNGFKESEKGWAKGNELKRKAEEAMTRRLKEETEEKERLARVYEKATSGSSHVEQQLPGTSAQYKVERVVPECSTNGLKSISPDTHTTTERALRGSRYPTFSSNRKAHTNNKSVLQNTNITAHDFVVRLGIVKCRNKGHHVQDIQATFTTISRLGNLTKITVPAGYCPDCKVYFIMDSIYQRIKHSGIPICRTMDERSYSKSSSLDMPIISSYGQLAQESVLKQFGYSVSQEEDLSREQRKNILSAIIDYNVLTKNEIISYLEYFINSRKKQKNPDGSLKYHVALERWRQDMDWIGEYKIGSFREVAIKRIIMNK